MHLFLLIKIKMILQPAIQYLILISIFLIMLVMLPILTSRLLKTNYPFTEIIYYITYSWMALLFLFISVSIVQDILLLVIHLIQPIIKKDLISNIPKIFYLIIPAVISILFFIYGYYEGKNIIVEEIIIETDKLPNSTDSISIAQISDIHLGTVVKEKRFDNIIDLLEKIKPDIVVATGDILDRTYISKNKIEQFQNINPKYGKYAVLGNHEYYIGKNESINFLKSSNFTVLRNEYVNINDIINIAGYDDKLFHNNEIPKNSISIKNNLFTIVLNHRPEIINDDFDLILSGHTHKGQIFPASIVSKIVHKYDAGLFKFNNNKYMYVNRGTGLWGPPIRFLAPPEITLIRIIKKT